MKPLLAPLLALAFAGPACSQDAQDEPVEETLKPVGVVVAAGVDRARADVGYLFDTVERGDMTRWSRATWTSSGT